jgi:hypothetical protein
VNRAPRGMGRDEKFAIAVAARVLGTEVHEHDIDGRQCAVDAIVHYPGGSKAALEVSSVRAEVDAGITGFLAERGIGRTVAGLRHSWMVEVPRDFHPADVRKVEDALRACEERGICRLEDLARYDHAIRAMVIDGLRGRADAGPGRAEDATGSRVYLMLPPLGGCTERGLEALPGELEGVLETRLMRAKVEKLAATGLAERHLVLLVWPGAFTFPVFDGLAFGGTLPVPQPRLPPGLTQVWLITGVRAGGVVRFLAGAGWTRDHPYDEPPGAA